MFSEGYIDILQHTHNDITQCIDVLYSFFNYLGYNTDGDFIFRIRNNIEKTIQWKTLHQPYFAHTLRLYNKKTQQWYNKTIYFNKELLLFRHLFYRHKILKKETLRQQYEHIQTYTCGASFHTTSNILVIDIDNHTQSITHSLTHNTTLTFSIAHILIEHLLKQYKFSLLYAEKNIFNGGYHLFFKLNNVYTQKEKVALLHTILQETQLYCYRNSIHIPTQLRFPFSKTYHPIAVYNYGDEEYINPSYYLTQCTHIPHHIVAYTKKEKSTLSTSLQPKLPHAIFVNSSTSVLQCITPQQFIATHENYISCGNRCIPMLHIVRTGKFNNWTIDNIINVIYACNDPLHPSKDLQKWSYARLRKEVEIMYNNSTIQTYTPSYIFSCDEFISNIHLIPSHILHIISSDMCIKKLITKCNYKYSERNKKIFSIILQEMVGYCYYRSIHKKQLSNTFSHIPKYQQLLQGFQFSPEFCTKLKNNYSILSNTDVYYIVRKILNSNFLFKKIILHNLLQYRYSFNSQYNYCKIYSIFNFNLNNYNFNDNMDIILSFFIILFFKNYFYKKFYIFSLNNKIIIFNNNLLCCGFLCNEYQEKILSIAKSKPFT